MILSEFLSSFGATTETFEALLTLNPRLSFSQKAEDVFILDHLKGRGLPPGMFVDFGAYHPWKFSNTFALYLQGWTGVNVEPNPDQYELFREHRPKDINLKLAVTPTPGQFTLKKYEVGAYNRVVPQGPEVTFEGVGAPFVEDVIVEGRTANEIFECFVGGKQFDLLTMDVEDMDEEILYGIDFDRFRPEILCAEVQMHNMLKPEFLAWLKSIGYTPVAHCFLSFIAIKDR